jgi:hypothetical protein
MACKWLEACFLRELERQGKISVKWRREYCESDSKWKNCRRYQLEEENVYHENILPDGSELR